MVEEKNIIYNLYGIKFKYKPGILYILAVSIEDAIVRAKDKLYEEKDYKEMVSVELLYDDYDDLEII